MADATERAINPLISDLLAHGHEFSFSQVMRVARMHLAAGGTEHLPEVPWQERVRVRPVLSLGFPAAEVARVERAEGGAELLVSATFLGLYGSASPLPTHYAEDLLAEAAADASASREFLDLLHQRLYHLYFQCWSKYRLLIQVAEEKAPQDLERLFCLLGLGEKELRDSIPGATALIRYLGLFAQPRSALGLQTLLRAALEVRDLEVQQCVLRRLAVPGDQRSRLGGANVTLGFDAILGSEMPDPMGKFRIHLGPLSKAQFDSFLPGTANYQKLARLVRFYITDPYFYDLKLVLAAGELQPMRLGDGDGPRLGWNSWCFSGDSLGEVSAVFELAQSIEQVSAQVQVAGERGAAAVATRALALTDYYEQELARLRDLATSFEESHQELASMVSGNVADPGVERLFQGVAFLNAILQRKLDDDVPELIQELTEALHPWLLRPVPATTTVAFAPKVELVQPLQIPAGAEVESIPVDGTRCRFKTCFEVTVHPLTLVDASFCHRAGHAPLIRLQFELSGIRLHGLHLRSLRFFLADHYPKACDLYLLLMLYLKRISVISPETGAVIEIAPACLKPVGFGDDAAMLSNEKGLLPGHMVLQEYFLFQDKFLFVDLYGLEACDKLGDGSSFEIHLELAPSLPVIPQLTANSFVLFATPVINIFKEKAKPMTFMDDQPQKVSTAAKVPEHHRIHSVDRVSMFEMGTVQQRNYSRLSPILSDSDAGHPCRITHSVSPSGDGFDTLLSLLPDGHDGTPAPRTKVNIDLTCTNGALPARLKVGEVCIPTSSIPEVVGVRNVKPVAHAHDPETGPNRQWRLLSSYSLNRCSLESVENLRAILKLYIPVNSCDRSAVEANLKRLDGVDSVESRPTDRLLHGSMWRGYDVTVRLRGDHFTGPGDLYLFSSVLERFFAGYVTQDCFTRTIVEEAGKGLFVKWPMRIGDRKSI